MSPSANLGVGRAVSMIIGLCLCLAPPQVGAQTAALNVSIQVFDPGLPSDESSYRELDVFPRIRNFEALLLPFALRETLASSAQWGAVRIVPEPDEAAELLITGRILHSDGITLSLQINAIDASGRAWLDKTYTDTPSANNSSNPAATGAQVFHGIYASVAADLQAVKDTLDRKTMQRIAEISMLRHAATLLPSAFADHLSEHPDGTYTVLRLPATSDPMFDRTQKIRNVEYVMTDAVDEKFQQLHGDIARTYDFWRKYRREYAEYLIEEANWQASDRSDAAAGSFEAVERSYDNYRWARMAEQEQRKWAAAFDNEVGPAVGRIESRVAELDDWVDNNYAEWQRLLAEIFSLETGLTELP
jgi:hypothetical protein